MKTKIFIVCASIVSLYGCAGINEKGKFEDLNGKVTALGASLDGTNAKIEDLNNRILLLNEKIETLKQNAAPAPAAAAPQPPEGLKVVSLGQDGEKKEQPGKTAPGQPAQPSPPPPKPPEPPAVNEGPEALYKRGHELFNSGRYAESRAAFSALLKSYPTDKLANNARYWIGESYYSERAFESALKFFEEVAGKYPHDNKTPDSLLKAGLSYIELNNNDKARETLERLIKLYPRSEAAEKAKKTLNKISKK